ncbi:uncharacterized protein BT62DRAFT_935068 [Guyanagaster necrorhizus]|uniref:Uncharacterized protein n=1 Tax=Guyanagaster necrorhizus TaxID=856835 RepID=A0A9P7VLM7_9AGAR|nr:uncharacterized protein BT62DRAFT_935068 [Guyanagaster necrorhizus MCA 3950]KAG7443446.1 hypothetical protein BT62DRAFT_935068 [Guyanagaster necrorhizus MCA 3950]
MDTYQVRATDSSGKHGTRRDECHVALSWEAECQMLKGADIYIDREDNCSGFPRMYFLDNVQVLRCGQQQFQAGFVVLSDTRNDRITFMPPVKGILHEINPRVPEIKPFKTAAIRRADCLKCRYKRVLCLHGMPWLPFSSKQLTETCRSWRDPSRRMLKPRKLDNSVWSGEIDE